MSFLDRENTVAPPGYNRWLVPPAALAIHLAIGQVYAFSVFKLPLNKALGITKPIGRRLVADADRRDLQHRHCLPGHVGGGVRQMG